MSLILEALKKSEAQRRLGEMPDLGTPITATRRRRRPLPWLAFAAVLALAAVGAWRYLRPVAPPQAAAPAAGQAESRSAAAPEPAMRVTPSAPAAQRATPKPAVPSTPAPAPTAPTLVPAPPRVATPPATQTETATAAPTPAPTAVATPAPAAAAAPAPAAAPPAPPHDDVPAVDELPPEVRAALPALPITMQVYSPDPKRRFVIIDGTRVVEGESVRGVTVQEIRQAGLVLEFQGHRALLRPGG